MPCKFKYFSLTNVFCLCCCVCRPSLVLCSLERCAFGNLPGSRTSEVRLKYSMICSLLSLLLLFSWLIVRMLLQLRVWLSSEDMVKHMQAMEMSSLLVSQQYISTLLHYITYFTHWGPPQVIQHVWHHKNNYTNGCGDTTQRLQKILCADNIFDTTEFISQLLCQMRFTSVLQPECVQGLSTTSVTHS